MSIDRQVDETCRLLELPRDHVIALSAQKALLARIRSTTACSSAAPSASSKTLIANEIVPAKQEILRTAVVKEMGTMVEGSLQSVMAQLTATQAELQELSKLSGKNRELAKTMLARLEKDRSVYLQHMESFKSLLRRRAQAGSCADGQSRRRAHRRDVRQERARHRGQLDHGRPVAQHELAVRGVLAPGRKILGFASETRNFVDKVYQEFQEKYGFVNLTPPPLNLEKHILSMKGLKQNTERFCRDPVNVMTEKHFLVKKLLQRPGHAKRAACFQSVRKDLDPGSRARSRRSPISSRSIRRCSSGAWRTSGSSPATCPACRSACISSKTQKMALGKQVEDLLRIKYKVLGTADRQRCTRRPRWKSPCGPLLAHGTVRRRAPVPE